MSKEKSVEELLQEVVKELEFLPDDESVRQGFLQGLVFTMIL